MPKFAVTVPIVIKINSLLMFDCNTEQEALAKAYEYVDNELDIENIVKKGDIHIRDIKKKKMKVWKFI